MQLFKVKVSARLFFLMILPSACAAPLEYKCCPIVSGRIEEPRTVAEFVANDAIFKEYLKNCSCK